MTELPVVSEYSPSAAGRWWSATEDGRIVCQLCPRECHLKPGDRGFCFVRTNHDGRMVLDTYGRSTGFCIDPIEKKPLNHFLPGTPVLSFGTAGCNLGCKFCQNWDISKSREVARLSAVASPAAIAASASQHGCRSVAFTYNDPVIWAEYALDTAAACRAIGLKTVAVTAGYISPQAREDFFAGMDAANIDLKAFTETFYHRITGAHLQPVLDTIRYVCRETDCWVELTNLIIPDANDQLDECKQMCDWLLENVGPDVPVHFTAFHPDFRMTDRPRTSHESLIAAYELARSAGLRYVYVGNVHDVNRQSTYCPNPDCRRLLIERDWHQLGQYALRDNRCGHCGTEIAGVFESQPGDWGRRRQPIQITSVPPSPSPELPTSLPATTQESAMSTTDQATRLTFSDQEQATIHQAACQVVAAAVGNSRPASAQPWLGELDQRKISGIYVTLKRGQTLRGCCGLQGPLVPLGAALIDAGWRTACEDPRMAPVQASELPFLDLSVSILGPPRPIGVSGDDRLDAVEVGRHGLRIAMGNRVGLLLPSVAREREWNSRQFLDAICRKAGLPPGAWRSEEANVQIFDGVDFGGPFVVDSSAGIHESGVLDAQQLAVITEWSRINLIAMLSGATPQYYAAGVPDGSVSGVILQVEHTPGQPLVGSMQFMLRGGLPLQSTLFAMSQNVLQAIAGVGGANHWQVRAGALSAIVHHGMDEDVDLAGVDCSRRALLAMDGRRWAIAFDRSLSAEELLPRVLQQQRFRSVGTQIYSAVCDFSHDQFELSGGPQAQSENTVRAPGVAGRFYPAEDQDREKQVDELFVDLPSVSKKTVAAAMVPHAGLIYSGKIAADVWRRIEIPETVLIIGPKHTSDGVDWAVSPHDVWQMSASTSMPGSFETAQQLAAAIPQLELDAVAHAAEHSIEVQLPILHRIAPQTKVVGIAMSGGTIDELKTAADALANWMRSQDSPPLLVISSDMNHFADDQENRRRDALALAALEQNDPAGLLDVCQQENISMCGQLPAALVLLTLQALGRDCRYEQIGYATSADVTGDQSRVVGYAGILF